MPGKIECFLEISPDSDFSIYNLPYGIFSRGAGPRPGVAIGGYILDLCAATEEGLFPDLDTSPWFTGMNGTTLNAFMEAGPSAWSQVRSRLQQCLAPGSPLAASVDLQGKVLVPQAEATMHLPVRIGDFTDFYASKEHATNVGTMFRDPKNALLPNWKHIPVGYSGRASSVVVSGVPVTRPNGQTVKKEVTEDPTFGPSRLLDFELEMGFFIGVGNELGSPVKMGQAADMLFGLCLLNDWSARDIQKYYYQPLGPSLGGKSFATSISPWIVPMAALEPFRVAPPEQDPEMLAYLADDVDRKNGTFDINLTVSLVPKGSDEEVQVTESNLKYLYYTFPQMVTHYASSGTNMRVGDLLGSGTISGPEKHQRGSMLEICWKGTEPLKLPNGEERKFIADGDEIVMRGYCQGDGYRVGFGEVRNVVLPAPKFP